MLAEVKTEISALTKQIGELRKEVVLCDGIAARSGVIKENSPRSPPIFFVL